MTSQLIHAKIRGVADNALRNLSAGLGLKCWCDTTSPRLAGTDATSTSEASSMSKASLPHTGSRIAQQSLAWTLLVAGRRVCSKHANRIQSGGICARMLCLALRRSRASLQFKLAHQIESQMELHGKAVGLADSMGFHAAFGISESSCMGTKPDGCRQRRHTGSECLQAWLDGAQQAQCATASATVYSCFAQEAPACQCPPSRRGCRTAGSIAPRGLEHPGTLYHDIIVSRNPKHCTRSPVRPRHT